MRILIAEDDAISRMILSSAIEQLGHVCIRAEDGNKAWELFQTIDVDVVISDRIMPGMDGLELCRRIRSFPKPAYTYFIFLTSLTEKEQLAEGMDSGADDYLTKPYSPDELRMRLAVATRITELHHQLAAQQVALERLNQQLYEQGRRDPLTQLGNRLQLSEDLAIVDDQVIRYGYTYSAVLCDIDFFKLYNDTYGHPAGDEVLQIIARTIREYCRSSDQVYRYGGEEFLFILPEQPLEMARSTMERLRQAIEAQAIPHITNPVTGIVTISAGIAVLSQATAKPIQTWIQEADTALYRAKEYGRNRIEVYSSSILV